MHVFVPSQFWTNGWYLVLEPAEIVAYLSIWAHFCEKGLVDDGVTGFAIGSNERKRYGLNNRRYVLHNLLEAYGLIRIVQDAQHPLGPKSSRRARAAVPEGKDAAPRRISIAWDGLDEDAFTVVSQVTADISYDGQWHPRERHAK